MAKRGKRWHREEIKTAVRMRGVTLTQLSRDNGLVPSACRHAVIQPHYAGEQAIAEFLGIAPQKIWPDRYDGETYLHPSSRLYHTSKKVVAK